MDQFDHRSDSANRLQKIIDVNNNNATIDFNYDSANRMTRIIRPNGVDTVYRYDGMSRLTVLRDFNVANTPPAINHRALSYNQASQISNITNKQDSRNFTYDQIDRLNTVTGSVAENYNYDQVGNRTSSHLSTTYTTTGFNKLTATASATYAHDQNGNMTSKVDSTGTWTYTWDFENRLKKVTRPDGQFVNYRYDGLGRRVDRTLSDGSWTKFVYDGLNVFQDQKSDGSSVKYINGFGIDDQFGRVVNNATQYLLKDHLGSTNNILDASGNVTETTTYDSFGKANTPLSTRYQYTGREFDDFSGLHYYRARWYDSKLGRFMSEDPIGFEGGDFNLFAYVENNPITFFDPMGLYPEGPINYLRDPVDHDSPLNFGGLTNGVSNTISDLLSLDDIADAAYTLGNHCLPAEDRVWAGGKLAVLTFLNAGGGGVVVRQLGKPFKWLKYGEELPIGKNFRAAPFGNRTGHPIGKYPHYHRRGPINTKGGTKSGRKGETKAGQSKDRHRPWEKHPLDDSFWDRF